MDCICLTLSPKIARVKPEELLKQWLSDMDAEEKQEMIGILENMAVRLKASLCQAGPGSISPPRRSPWDEWQRWRRN